MMIDKFIDRALPAIGELIPSKEKKRIRAPMTRVIQGFR